MVRTDDQALFLMLGRSLTPKPGELPAVVGDQVRVTSACDSRAIGFVGWLTEIDAEDDYALPYRVESEDDYWWAHRVERV